MDLSNENILHIKKDGIEYLQFKILLNYPEIKQKTMKMALISKQEKIKRRKL